MIRKMLYVVGREDGGYSISPKKPMNSVPYKVRWRLIAEAGKAITDGENIVTVIDVHQRKDCEAWSDCDLSEELKTEHTSANIQ